MDEAHRLNAKSGIFRNLGENQVKEIIEAAKFSVFFIDEYQRISVDDIGSVEEIERWAKRVGAEISTGRLESQFRCNGSDGYLAWLDNALGIRETANYDLEGSNFDFKVFDSPRQLQKAIERKDNENKVARIVAGYCWDWPKGTRADSSVHDIQIGDWGISWNLEGEIYALAEGSIHEAGCIHTTQGLEFDYVGVIIGPDLRFERGGVVTDYHKRSKNDQSIRGLKTMERKEPERALGIADEIIKNTYRTLMTRGMKGCYVYCVDKALGEYFAGLAGEGFAGCELD